MRNLFLGLLALCALAAASSSAQASMCRGPHGWNRYSPQQCAYYAHRSRGYRFGNRRGYRIVRGVRHVTVRRHRQVSVPSPEWIAEHVQHHVTNVCVPCPSAYAQNPVTCQCDLTTLHPGPPPE